ncbi:hypothetical protein O0L34_g13060 [Tuta absoluta]|nr:hypothetical protein O0L34_g13060 [Tuta absoluta]
MSTRSGKRIHSTAFENNDSVQSEVVPRTDKKTRSKRMMENEAQPEFAVPKLKSQKHYVAYPSTDDEGGYTTASDALDAIKSARKLKKNTLKEHNANIPQTENVDDTVIEKKNTRITRRTRKFAENVEDVTHNGDTEIPFETAPNKKVRGKKNKKKNSKNNSDINENPPEPEPAPVEEPKASKKSKKKKKKGKQGNSSTEEVKLTLNKSNASTDSFHSAAGSPAHENMDIDVAPESDKTLVKENYEQDIKTRRKSSIKPSTPKQADIESELNDTLKKDAKSKRKSSLKNTTFNKEDANISNGLNSTYDKNKVETADKPKSPVAKETKARRSLRLDNITTGNLTDANDVTKQLNTTFEKETESRKSLPTNNSENGNNNSNALNTTFEKSPKKPQSRVISLDSTFDKSDPKLNTTFDKAEAKNNSAKSSLISSDEGTVNVTFDKENSGISITSDDSKTDNIVNTTPVLIESSMDESRLSTSKTSENLNVTKEISPPQKDALQLPVTPLKREGTFTKESPEILNKTPTKRQTLPSPGMTPFNVTRSSTREKSVMNVTRSIEKSRSSLAALAPSRQTRVMFCSPVNNPAVVMQQKKKVIKSSMKGSNKSFVFDESASVVKPASRKRSYTQNDADDRRVKRTRLADDLQNSVDRLSRPRTSSATAKLADTTPSKKAPTPAKPRSEPKRTKLPNFAALHQKQFEKMESLDECQRRKLKRAKKMLVPKTPNGTITVLERSSPRGTAEQARQKEVAAKKPETPKKPETTKKPVTPAKKFEPPTKKTETSNKTDQASKLTKLPTLESLRPGFTRFGFKMNTDFNPFSIPSKTVTKPKNLEKPNGLTAKPTLAAKTPVAKSRLPPLPSMTGGTTIRKEAAKQVVMREKSFTSLSGKRDMKRNESRTIIKGVRTNRRFDLQMKMRNID